MDCMKSFENIQRILMRKSEMEDKALFNAWERGEISTVRCLQRFRRNNRQSLDIDISLDEFSQWLRSLGYIRRM